MDRCTVRPTYYFSGIAIALLVTLLSACGPTMKPFVSGNLQGGEDSKLAILPFDNLSSTPGAAKVMENLVLIEFLKRSTVRIVDPGEVSAALSKERIRLASSLSRESIRALGTALGVRFLAMGTVHQFEVQTSGGAGGQTPAVGLALRIIDAGTGEIVWAGTAARRGNDREIVFGIGKIHSLNALGEETAEEFARAFAEALGKEK